MDNIFSFLNNQEMNYIFMEIRQLEYFRAVVEEGTVSGAAKVLKMTQSRRRTSRRLRSERRSRTVFRW